MVQRRIYQTRSLHEVPLVIDAAGPTWRNLIATAIYLGLRKGELFALRKADVDLDERLLYVRRSHGDDTVKGKKALVLPIPLPLVQYLQDAIDRSPSEYVFPGTDGKRRPEHTKGTGLPAYPHPRRPRRRLPPSAAAVSLAAILRSCKLRTLKSAAARSAPRTGPPTGGPVKVERICRSRMGDALEQILARSTIESERDERPSRVVVPPLAQAKALQILMEVPSALRTSR